MRVVSVDASVAPVLILDVQLDHSQTTNEVCFNRECKTFLRKQHAHARARSAPAGDVAATSMHIKEESNILPSQETSQHAEPTKAPSLAVASQHSRLLESPEQQPQEVSRFGSDLISRLEKKYCGGLESDDNAAQSSEGGDDSAQQHPSKKRGRQSNDNYYDLDDPFIDDSDALDVIEQHRRLSKTKTKHQGFFMSTGELQIHDAEASNPGAGSNKKRRSREPDNNQNEALKLFQKEVTEVFGRKFSMEKRLRTFPKQLEPHLGVLDQAFASIASTETQVPYLERLVEMMPLAKNTIKSAVLRLRYQDRIQIAKQAHESAKQQLQAEVRKCHAETQKNSEVESVASQSQGTEGTDGSVTKPEVWNDIIATLLVNTIRHHEEWLAYEIKLSKVKRPEDKKELSQDGSPELEHARMETELYAEISSFWPTNAMNENHVRRQYTAAATLADANQKRKRESSEAPRKKSDPGPAAKAADGKDTKRKSTSAVESSQSSSTSGVHSSKKSSQKKERKSMPAKSDTIQRPTTFDESDFIPSQSN